MWTRDDIQKEAEAARRRAMDHQCFSVPILEKIMMDVAARMALDNAADIADRAGEPALRDQIEDLKDAFNLGD